MKKIKKGNLDSAIKAFRDFWRYDKEHHCVDYWKLSDDKMRERNTFFEGCFFTRDEQLGFALNVASITKKELSKRKSVVSDIVNSFVREGKDNETIYEALRLLGYETKEEKQ